MRSRGALLTQHLRGSIAVLALTLGTGPLASAQTQTQTGVAVAVPFFDGAGTPSAVAIHPDGRVVAVGRVLRTGRTDTDFAVMQFLPDGTPDSGFGDNGRVTTDFAGRDDVASAVVIQPDGALVVAGSTANPSGPVTIAALARYSATGAPDAAFGTGGRVVDPSPVPTFQNWGHRVTAVSVAPSGEILVAVSVFVTATKFSGFSQFQFQRYSASGVPLAPWGSIDWALQSDQPFAFASNGRVVTLGRNFWMSQMGRLTRYTSVGELDATFNGTGVLESHSFAFPGGVATQADDTIVVVSDASIQRFTQSGAVDTTFGQAGTVTTGPAYPHDVYRVVTVDANGTILTAGGSPRISNDPDQMDFGVLATTRSGQIILNVAVDFGGAGYADAVRIVGGDAIAAGMSWRSGRLDVAWTRLVLNPWQPVTGGAIVSDRDGDGKADMIVTASSGEWRIATSSTGFAGHEASSWGAPIDTKIVADFDGNGRMDLTAYRPSDQSFWYVIDPNLVQTRYQWGSTGDLPVAGDYGGDTRTDVAVFRPQTGEWLICDPITGYYGRYQWGQRSDVPVPRDYDGDGRTDLAIYRPSTGLWAVFNLATGTTSAYQWGMPGDVPVPGDYFGTGRLQIAIYRPSTGDWWIFDPATGQYSSMHWGGRGDVAVPGDYVGDRRTDLAVWRPSTGAWFVWDLGTSSFTAVALGAPERLR
jgi:uncharacterized delta-60 repeat protein